MTRQLKYGLASLGAGLVLAQATLIVFLQPMTLVTTDLGSFYRTGNNLGGTCLILGVAFLLAVAIVAFGALTPRRRPARSPFGVGSLDPLAVTARELTAIGAASIVLGAASLLISFGYLAVENVHCARV
jgi:hypothetical protein